MGGGGGVVTLAGPKGVQAVLEGERLPENMGPGAAGAAGPPAPATSDAPLAKDLRRQRGPLRDEPTVYAALARKDSGSPEGPQAGSGGGGGESSDAATQNTNGEAGNGH